MSFKMDSTKVDATQKKHTYAHYYYYYALFKKDPTTDVFLGMPLILKDSKCNLKGCQFTSRTLISNLQSFSRKSKSYHKGDIFYLKYRQKIGHINYALSFLALLGH